MYIFLCQHSDIIQHIIEITLLRIDIIFPFFINNLCAIQCDLHTLNMPLIHFFFNNLIIEQTAICNKKRRKIKVIFNQLINKIINDSGIHQRLSTKPCQFYQHIKLLNSIFITIRTSGITLCRCCNGQTHFVMSDIRFI